MLTLLEEQADVVLVMGARVRLLGRTILRSPYRHYFGRVFATLASLTLRLPVYDTQCGAKLFRVSETTMSVFREPFLSRWIFDVEVLARLGRALGVTGRGTAGAVVEFPLTRWTDMAGSKVRPSDFLRAGSELIRIRRHYRGPRVGQA